MIRYGTFLLISIFIVSVFGLFQIKYSVQYLDRDVEELKRQLEEEKAAIHVLKAEWAFLNNPQRLKSLSKRYLSLEEIKISQIKQINKNAILLSENKNKAVHNDLHQVKHESKAKTKWNFKEKTLIINQPGRDKPYIVIGK